MVNGYGGNGHGAVLRDDDRHVRDAVLDCAHRLTTPGIRVLLLHGGDPEGRAAFVAHGLVTFLEGGNRGFSFLKPFDGPVTGARGMPLASLARAMHGLTGTDGTLLCHRRPHGIDLSGAWSGEADPVAFLTGARRDHSSLLGLFRAVTRVLADTLVTFVDRADGGVACPEPAFLEFVRAFGLANVDAKLILSVNTTSVPALLVGLAGEHVDGPYLAGWRLDMGSWTVGEPGLARPGRHPLRCGPARAR